jgi:hypothetical protein
VIDVDALNLDRLVGIYIDANTPAYLYKHFRSDPTVWELSKKMDAPTLMTIYSKIAAKNDRTPREVALGYAALFAITLGGDYETAHRTLNQLRSYDLDWAPQIVAMFSARPSSSSQTLVSGGKIGVYVGPDDKFKLLGTSGIRLPVTSVKAPE